MKWLRDVHLVVGLFCLPFLIVYGIDGIRSSHGSWLSSEEHVEERTLEVRGRTPESIARELAEEHGLAASLAQGGGDEQFVLHGPAGLVEVQHDAQAGTVQLRHHRGGIVSTAHHLHVSSGVSHASSLANLWGWLAVLVSAGLVILGASGLWLWTRRLRERRLGLLFLVGSLGYCALCLSLITWA